LSSVPVNAAEACTGIVRRIGNSSRSALSVGQASTDPPRSRRAYTCGLLPHAQSAGTFFARPSVPSRAKVQVVFLSTVAEDPLVQPCLGSLVLGRPRPRSGTYLHLDEVLAFLRGLEAEHPELGRWRPYMRRGWASGFLSLLRDGGLERHPERPETLRFPE
jgi:hypothetical protein